MDKVQYFDSNREFFYGDYLNEVCIGNISSGESVEILYYYGNTDIPKGAKNGKLFFSLVKSSSNTIINKSEKWFSVSPAPSRDVLREITTVPSGVSFNPIPIVLDITQNSEEGSLTASEFTGQYGGANPLLKTYMIPEEKYNYWKFIPINRFWTVFGTQTVNTTKGNITITYDPTIDFPNNPEFREDSLVIAILNPNSGELEALPTTLDKMNNEVSSAYNNFFTTWVVASKQTNIISAIEQISDKNPEAFKLNQNYPNPFNPQTVIEFSIPHQSYVTLKVFNLLGETVVTLIDQVLPAG